MVKEDPEHIFLGDCRTRAEYQFVGQTENAYNTPVNFLTNKVGEKGYAEETNPNFGKDLLARFYPETDTLIIFCRSGNRGCTTCNEAIKAGFSEDKIFNMMGGFEGGKNKNKNKDSVYYGKRWAGGWKLEGLPWTYSMDHKLMHKPDVDDSVASNWYRGKPPRPRGDALNGRLIRRPYCRRIEALMFSRDEAPICRGSQENSGVALRPAASYRCREIDASTIVYRWRFSRF